MTSLRLRKGRVKHGTIYQKSKNALPQGNVSLVTEEPRREHPPVSGPFVDAPAKARKKRSKK